MRKLRQQAYNTTAWRKLRNNYILSHPICEECLKKGIVYAGTVAEPLQVHHKISPFKNGKINYELLLSDQNLEVVCAQCHAEIHNKENGYISPEEIIKQLDELFDENITDKELEEKYDHQPDNC